MSERRRGAGAFFTNWRTFEGSFSTKLRLTIRNRFRAVVLLKGCCGHDGEPGC